MTQQEMSKTMKNEKVISSLGITEEEWLKEVKKRLEENRKLREDELQTKYNMLDNIWD